MTANCVEFNHTYTPPMQSRALREIPVRSRASSRGEMVDTNPFTGERFVNGFESGIEKACYYQLRAKPEIVEIREQYPVINYRSPQGKQKLHTFDLFAVTTTGLRIAYVAKTHRYIVKNDYLRELKCIEAAALKSPIDNVRLITERHYTRGYKLNAERVVVLSKCIIEPTYNEFLQQLKSLSFVCTVEELIQKFELGSNGFTFALKSAFDGYLSCNLNDEFGLWSRVSCSGGVQ